MRYLFFLFAFLACTAQGFTQEKKPVLNHLAYYVNNLPKSTAFYQNILQLDTIPEPFHDGKHTWFKVAEHSQLHLIEGAGKNIATDKNTHLCFSVPSMEAVIARLQQAGIAYEDWPGKKNAVTTRVDGVQQIYLQDPDGYWIELNNDRY